MTEVMDKSNCKVESPVHEISSGLSYLKVNVLMEQLNHVIKFMYACIHCIKSFEIADMRLVIVTRECQCGICFFCDGISGLSRSGDG